MARRSGDAEGRIARGAAGMWDEFDGSTPRSNGFAPRRASDPMSLRRTRRSPPEDFTFYVVVRTLLSYAKKIISYRRFVRRIRTHPRAQSAPPCGARPCTNPFFARSWSPWPSRRCAPVFHANPNLASRARSLPHIRFFPRLPTQAGHSTHADQRARTRGARRARGAPRRGLRARRRVLRRDRMNPAADSLARPTFPSPPRSIPPRRHAGINTLTTRPTRRVGKRRPTLQRESKPHTFGKTRFRR